MCRRGTEGKHSCEEKETVREGKNMQECAGTHARNCMRRKVQE